jgi:hypothetical protein
METHISDIIHVIQLAVAPVFLLSAVGHHAAANSCRHTFFGCTAPKD